MPSGEREHAGGEPPASIDLFHPIPTGTVVKIKRRSTDKTSFDEGLATVEAPAPGRHRYCVRFTGDPVFKVRLVGADDPLPLTDDIALDAWDFDEAGSSPFSDFFPDDLPE